MEELYGGRIRIRVCGILQREGKVLLVNHRGVLPGRDYWNCPGGGMERGESMTHTLRREFLEEANVEITPGPLYHWEEFRQGKLHAIELYFTVSALNFAARLGADPEYNILTELKWFSAADIHRLSDDQCPKFLRSLCLKTIDFH